MQASWWEKLHERYLLLDLNGDGAVTGSDFLGWAQWLFYLPGDALIALLGPTPLAGYVDLPPATAGGTGSALISVAGWVLALLALYYFLRLLFDAADPTGRHEKRERREARERVQRIHRERILGYAEGRAPRPRRRWGWWVAGALLLGAAIAVPASGIDLLQLL